MKKLTFLLVTILVFGHLQLEFASILGFLFPELQWLEIQPFIASTEKIYILWYIKFMCDDTLWIFVMFLVCKLAYQYSFRLFRVSCVFFVYRLFDLFMLTYNFKRSYWVYWVLLGACIIAVALIAYPEKKTAKVTSIEN